MITKQQIQEILYERTKNWDFKSLSTLPHPFTLKNCEAASRFLANAIQNNKKILIVGDYDVDGIIASVVMMKFFECLGYKNVSYTIPNRFTDGYGVSTKIIEQNPSDVIITVDNGITAFEAALFAKQNNIPFIITDHHLPKDTLPEATYIINPQQKDCTFPQKEICGAMVAWYFCAGIKIILNANINLTPFLELVMLATIADMMPLTQINKCIVLFGLKRFQNSSFLAIQRLKTRLHTKSPTAIDLSFGITPLLNAAGRMGEGKIASEFLLSDEDGLFAQLLELNEQRKIIAKAILSQACKEAIIYGNAVIAKNNDWHEGVLGIVATQIAEKYKRPAFVFSKTSKRLKGSARSWQNIDLMGILLQSNGILEEFGGHSKAAGLSLKEERFEDFCIFLQNLKSPPQCNEVEDSGLIGEIAPKDIDSELFEILAKFEPYGQANPKPMFQSKLQILNIEHIKSIHKKFRFAHTDIYGIYFFCQEDFSKGDVVEVVFSLQEDSFSAKPIMTIQEMIKN